MENARRIKPISDMVEQLDLKTWRIGNSHVLTLDNYGYTISDSFTPNLSPVMPCGPIRLVVLSQLSCVWAIGDSAFLKVATWTSDMETEAETIRWVRQNVTTVPVPKVLWEYIDQEAYCSFMISEKLPGEELNEVWRVLNVEQQQEVVQQVVQHIKDLASLQSKRLETTNGKLICEPYLDSTKSIDPLALHLLEPENVKEHQSIWGPDKNLLVFQHTDLGPKNIMVSVQDKTVKVSGILDLAMAEFLPKAWICTKILVSRGMNFQWEVDEGETQWRLDLAGTLIDFGYMYFTSEWNDWHDKRRLMARARTC